MCKIGIMLGAAGENLFSAILFMNSNKSEKNIRKKVDKTREKCLSHGIILGHDVVICKGPDRDVDRDAVNLLISFLMTGQYDMVAVDKLTDLTEDVSDMEELMKDAAKIGVGFLELSTIARITEAVQVQVGVFDNYNSKAGRSVPAFTYRGLYVIGQSAN